MDLISLGYRMYPQRVEWPYRYKTLWQKTISSPVVCETNDRLSLNVWEYAFTDNPENFEVEITAELKGKWWKLSCYSLNRTELSEQLTEIESTLANLANTI